MIVRVLDATGDTKLEWDPADEAKTAEARETVNALRAQGFEFFLVDGRPADAVTAGNGALEVRRIPPERMFETPPQAQAGSVGETAQAAVRRGRKPKDAGAATEVVAVPRMRGG